VSIGEELCSIFVQTQFKKNSVDSFGGSNPLIPFRYASDCKGSGEWTSEEIDLQTFPKTQLRHRTVEEVICVASDFTVCTRLLIIVQTMQTVLTSKMAINQHDLNLSANEW